MCHQIQNTSKKTEIIKKEPNRKPGVKSIVTEMKASLKGLIIGWNVHVRRQKKESVKLNID